MQNIILCKESVTYMSPEYSLVQIIQKTDIKIGVNVTVIYCRNTCNRKKKKKKKGIQREQEICGNALQSVEMAVKSLAKGLIPWCSPREILLETSAYS